MTEVTSLLLQIHFTLKVKWSYESEEYKIMCEEYKKIEKEYDSYYED